jgi:hypothetical protein
VRIVLAVFIISLVMQSVPAPLLAKGDTVKITIKGADLTTPIEIIDPQILANFRVWAGPGTSSNESQGLIIDWSKGPAKGQPKGFPVYEVSFYVNLPKERLVYVVFYESDPSMDEGYVYLPGKADPSYPLNVSTIFHGVEGKWFHAWSAWEKVARPLIARARLTSSTRQSIGGQSFR